MEKIVVIKIGGNCIDDEVALSAFLSDFAAIKFPKILIHGGGKLATQLASQLNIETTLIDGRRITDEKMLDVVTMVYAGLINKKIVAQLQAAECNAVGFCGADANLIQAHQRVNNEINYGFVGDIDKVNADFLVDLLDKNYTPILAPITHNKKGILLNTNADTLASSIAIALAQKSNKVDFYYCFEKNGLLANVDDDMSLISAVNIQEIELLKQNQTITKGMIPKVDNISFALKNGVDKVVLCNAKHIGEIFEENSILGTTFTIK
ncbi:MAG: acetylglutamate kinase [Chitinophagales bacterium]